MKLSTIQKRENLNIVTAEDEIGPGGAYHRYEIKKSIDNCEDENCECQTLNEIVFQKGPRLDPESIHGVLDTDLLEICRHRLQCFQDGPYSSRYNAIALTKVEEALMWLNRRVEDRIERNVLGTYEK